MGNAKSDSIKPTAADRAGEDKLRGEALDGSERKGSADHIAYDKARDTDKVVRVDDEEDTLYSDGLELEDDSPVLANTRKNNNMG